MGKKYILTYFIFYKYLDCNQTVTVCLLKSGAAGCIIKAQKTKDGGLMNYKFTHNNINVFDLEKSMRFYGDALGLKEKRRIEAEDGSFIIVFMAADIGDYVLELTWMKDRQSPYDLGDNEIHIGLSSDDYQSSYRKHKEMGVICYENEAMGIYFIEDPDGYWVEVVPANK